MMHEPIVALPGTLTVNGEVVTTELDRPKDAHALLVLSHGAGAGMRHAFMRALTEALVACGIAVFRYQFPFFELGRRRIDPAPVLEETVVKAVEAARAAAPDLPLFAGGKSMGGRMTSRAAVDPGLDVRGLIFFGFPLHRAKQPAVHRALHLPQVTVPMLFLQGTRDHLAELELIQQVTSSLPLATLVELEGADHAFMVLKRSGRTDAVVFEELIDATVTWIHGQL